MLTIQMVKAILSNEKGQGMVEYGLILALIAVAALVAMTGIGTALVAKLQAVATAL